MLHPHHLKSLLKSNRLPHKFPHFPPAQTRAPFSTLSSLFNRCSTLQQLEQIHARFILHGLHQNPTLCSKLIDCYSKLGLLNLSLQVFNSIAEPNSVLYNTILRNLSKFEEYERTLLLYREMVIRFIYPDEETYPFVLKSCVDLSDSKCGEKIHGHVLKLGFDSSDLVATALVGMYGETNNFENDCQLFEKKPVKDLDYWNSLINEASQNGKAEQSFRLFVRMRKDNQLKPEPSTLISLLKSVVTLDSLKLGNIVHCLVIMSNFCGDLSVSTALLSMYSKLGNLLDARLLFDKMPEKDLVVWNIMISAYSRQGKPRQSLELLRYVGRRSGIRADLFTALPSISSITQLKRIDWGKQMHAYVIRSSSDYQTSVHNSLIDMYSECDALVSAIKVFDLLKNKTIVSWSAMIKGYVTHDQSLNALSLFSKMKSKGIKADFITIINILPACVDIGALDNVKYLHGYSLKFGLYTLQSVNTALLISYAKCGCIEMAEKVFEEEKANNGTDVIMWNSMISAHAKHGHWSQCFKLYNKMTKSSNSKPDQVTFLGLLTACVNSGLVEKGKECFNEMIETHGFKPSQEHFACRVDLLGRAGLIDEARKLVKEMPIKPDARVWGPLLSACKVHSETELAEFAAEKLVSIEPRNAGNYILLSNIYAAAGKWEGVAKMRSLLRDEGLKKTVGCSWLETNGNVHEFRVADESHPRSDEIYDILGNLELEIKDEKGKSSEKN